MIDLQDSFIPILFSAVSVVNVTEDNKLFLEVISRQTQSPHLIHTLHHSQGL